MDEPTSGLEPQASGEFTRISKELSNGGKTMLMAAHDLFNAVNRSTRIGMMKDGKLMKVLDAEAVTAQELQNYILR